jgi:cell division septation protein DedD
VRKIAAIQTPYVTVRSTMSGVAAPSLSQAGGKRYVQVGTFGDPTNAQNTISRFQSRGLPVAARSMNRDGRNLKIVLLGPFGSAAQLQSALVSAQGAGFGDAFYVN